MTDRYAVIGNPIAHSKSPQIHAEFAKATGQDMEYSALLAPLQEFRATVEKFCAQGGKGVNVTVPFKLEALHIATTLSPQAKNAEAVNTLRFDSDSSILGHNTDGIGLIRDIQKNWGFAIKGKRVLLMGAGGAARGVAAPLVDEQPECLVIANRSLDKVHQLIKHLQQHTLIGATTLQASPYEQLGGRQFDLIINATASSLNDTLPPVPGSVFGSASFAYDMMYGRGLTPFLQFAQQQDAGILADGLGMLVEQAAESFYLWRGVRPATEPVIALLKNASA